MASCLAPTLASPLQVATIKRRLQLLLPGVRVFLDVDDLDDISKLEEWAPRPATRTRTRFDHRHASTLGPASHQVRRLLRHCARVSFARLLRIA